LDAPDNGRRPAARGASRRSRIDAADRPAYHHGRGVAPEGAAVGLTIQAVFVPNIGLTELLVVLAIALLVIGPKRLPDIGRQVGRAIREFRRAGSTVTKELGLDEVAGDVRDLKESAQKARDSVNVRKQLGLDDLGPLDLDAEETAAETPTDEEKAAAAAATAAEAVDHSLTPAPPAPTPDAVSEAVAECGDAASAVAAEDVDAASEAGDQPAPAAPAADALAAPLEAAVANAATEEPAPAAAADTDAEGPSPDETASAGDTETEPS
jgi:Tat protein translocase TatB subunit